MEAIQRNFKFLTAGFPHGAYQSQNHNKPELRAPSVRGQIRWWFDALYDPVCADEIFGKIGNGSQASKITVRVKELDSRIHKTRFIPHKGSQGGEKKSYQAGSSFQLTVCDRRQGLANELEKKLVNSIDAWLLLGAIGQRSNRAAGSVWAMDNPPQSCESYTQKCKQLLEGSKLSFAILPDTFANESDMRHLAGDFLADEAFQNCRTPFGSARPRKPSNLKLKAVELENLLRLVAIWDGRNQMASDLTHGINILAQSKKIGTLLNAIQDQF